MIYQTMNKYVHVLTGDECFYVINISWMQHSQFFVKNYESNKMYGSCFNPIFLQNITGIQFEAILKYIQSVDLDNDSERLHQITAEMIEILSGDTCHKKTIYNYRLDPGQFCSSFDEVVATLELPQNDIILQKMREKKL